MSYRVDDYDKSLVIDGFQEGIADSPFDGISNLRNVNIISIPGEASVNFSTARANYSTLSGSVTNSSDADDTLTVAASNLADGMALTFYGAGLPGGVVAGTKYLIKKVTATTLRVYSTYANYVANSYQNITADSGTGTYATVDMGKPTYKFADKVSAKVYVIDANGRVWMNLSFGFIYLLGVDGTTTTNASGNGVMVYQGYLFAFRNALIDYMLLSTGAWTYGWQTMNTGASVANSHYAHFGQDNVIYYCDAAYVGSFRKIAGVTFNPAGSNGTDYIWTQDALTLPSDDVAQCLTELGINLLVGGQDNVIYPWNRTATDFSYPILVAEKFIARMVTVNTNTFILAGTRGRIYITNGSQATLFKKVPDHISGVTEPFFQWGDLASNRNQLYFGILAKNPYDGVVISQYGGVWAMDIDSKAIRLENKLSYGTYAGIATVIIPTPVTTTGNPAFPAVTTGGGLTYIGWDSGEATYGIDAAYQEPYTGSEATIDTDLIPIGTYDKPRDFTRVEYRLSRPLKTGESITIKYRLIFDTSDTGYTTVLEDTTAGDYSLSGPVNFKNAQWVQFQIVLNSVTGGSSEASYVRLREMRILGLV